MHKDFIFRNNIFIFKIWYVTFVTVDRSYTLDYDFFFFGILQILTITKKQWRFVEKLKT